MRYAIFLSMLAISVAACDSRQPAKPKAEVVKPNAVVENKASPPTAPKTEAKAEKPDPNKALASRVKKKLESTPKLDAQGIQVSAEGGKVVLFGTVDTAPERKLAMEAAQSVEGVEEVTSKLVVVAGS